MRSAKRIRGTALAVLVSALTMACSQDTQEKGEALFGSLDAPSFNRLRGVYTTTVDLPPAETVEIRLKFDDDVIVGASRCTKAGTTVVAVGEAALTTNALDAAEGTVALEGLVMSRPYAEGRADLCEAGLPAGTYAFKVEEDRLTLTIGRELPRAYKKIGD